MLLMNFRKDLVGGFGREDFRMVFLSSFSFQCHDNQNNNEISTVCSPYPIDASV